MSGRSDLVKRIRVVVVFAVAFAFVESSVVVYLRALYYPLGFTLPLKEISSPHLIVELLRELSTIVMLWATALLAGKLPWERFGYFLIAFGVWDIFYYIWLKVLLAWPRVLTDWDVLFLVPIPWIAPVFAPVAISALMIVSGIIVLGRIGRQEWFKPTPIAWLLSLFACVGILYSFMHDTEATLHGALPSPYAFTWLIVGIALLGVSLFLSCMKPRTTGSR